MMAETGIEFPLIEASAEDVPLPDESFDLALSEYGASIWCDPRRWIPEAHRLLRPGGEIVFLCNSPLATICMPDEGKIEERLVRSQFELGRMQWPGENEGVEYHLGHGEMLALLRETGTHPVVLRENETQLSRGEIVRISTAGRCSAKGVPGTTTPEHEPFEQVTEAQAPSASITTTSPGFTRTPPTVTGTSSSPASSLVAPRARTNLAQTGSPSSLSSSASLMAPSISRPAAPRTFA
jgi:hypothetical protein